MPRALLHIGSLFLAIVLLQGRVAIGQVTISGGVGAENLCAGASAYQVISPIVITETSGNDIDISPTLSVKTFNLSLSDADFVFEPNVGSFAFSGAGAATTFISGSVTATQISISIIESDDANASGINTITITGLRVKATAADAGPRYIQRPASGGGDLVINNLGPGTNIAAVASFAAPTVGAGSDGVVCEGSTFSFVTQSTPASSSPGASVSWSHNGTGTLSNGNTLTPTYTPGSGETGVVTFMITATNNNGSCSAVSDQMNLTINANPVIVASPAPQTLCEGGNVTFHVSAAGTGLTYQWQENGVNLLEGGIYSGVTTANLTLTNVPASLHNKSYRVVVNGVCGNEVTPAATLTVNPPPTAFADDENICSGAVTDIAITNPNTVAGTTYTWSVQNMVNVTGASGGAGTSIAQQLTATDGATAGTVTYLITPSAAGCNGPVFSVHVAVNPIPTVAASPQTICAGSSTAVAISNPNGVAGTTFSWLVVTASNVTGASAGNGSMISQVLTTADGVNTGTVRYRITPAAGICMGSSIETTVTVVPSPKITNVPASLSRDVCTGTTLNFTPTSSVSATTYTWTSSVTGGLSGITASGTGAITDTPVNSSSSPGVATYTITPHAGGCAGSPVNYVVTVWPLPTASANAQTLCSGQTTAVAISNVNGVAGTVFQWSVISVNNVTGALAGTGNTISQVLHSADGTGTGTVTYEVIPQANGCAGPAHNVTVTVNAVPQLSNPSTSFSQTICSGQALNFVPASAVPGASFAWTSSYSAGISPGSVTAAGAGIITDAPVNTLPTGATVTYRIVPSKDGCSGQAKDFVITVQPVPSATAANVTICSGATAVINVSAGPANVSGTTFSWTASPSTNVTGASDGNGSSIRQVLNTTNATAGSVLYAITPSANGCSAPPTNVTVTINPIAMVNAGADFAVCEPTTIPLAGSLGGSATSGTWTIVAGGGAISTSTTAGADVTATYTVATGDIGGYVKLLLTTNDPDGAGGPCAIVSDEVTIYINRKAVITVPADYTVCEPASIHLMGVLGGSATTGLWSIVTGTGTLSATSVTGPEVTADYQRNVAEVATALTFRLTTNDPDGTGPCAAASDDIQIHINESAKVSAGADDAVCQNEVVVLDGTVGGTTATVSWSGGSGTSQFSAPGNPDTNYALTAADIASGQITLTLTTNDPDGGGPCMAVSDAVLIKVNKLPEVGLAGLEAVYAENEPIDYLEGFPSGGDFTGHGIVAGTNQFNPDNTPYGTITITYDYTDPVTGCSNTISKNTIVNPVTDIDFDIDPIRRDPGTTFPIICANSGKHRFIGYPAVNDPGAKSAFFTSSEISARIEKIGSEYYINTDGLSAGAYEVQYIFTNTLDATDTLTKDVIVYSGPRAVISVEETCKDQPLVFTEASYIDSPASGYIAHYAWSLGENGEERNIRNPEYAYEEPGNKTVSLRVETNQGCFHDTTRVIRVGLKPEVNFTWGKICSGIETTEFQDITVASEFSSIEAYAWDFGDGDILSFGAAGASVPAGTHGGRTSGSYQDPNHQYQTFEVYDVTLTVSTTDGCEASKTQRVYILDYDTPGATEGYFTDFESGQGTWVALAESDTSWVFGTPQGQVINTAASGNNAWWTGRNTDMTEHNGTYFKNEVSEVIGPCLNLTQLKRPMIALNYWSDTQAGFDGAVLQYSTDGGINWQAIGDADGHGIHWYNSRDLASQPGGQDNFAWSDSTSGWRNARFSLDGIPEAKRSLVVFRIAFASNADNPNNRVLEGFAFDDVYIGEKTRNVLVEHFTNDSYGPSNQADVYFENVYKAQLTERDSSDFILLQYHLASPSPDPLNADNPVDPAARALLYGVSQPPTSIMDGIQGRYFGKEFNGAYSGITAEELERRALEDPRFNIGVEVLSSREDSLRLVVNYTYIDSTQGLRDPLILHVALVEDGVNGNVNVLRKLLLQPEGRLIDSPWPYGHTETARIDYHINVPVANPDNLYIIAFVQEKNMLSRPSKHILQSVIVKAPTKVGTVPVGLPDDPAAAAISALRIYPNPASQVINLGLERNLTRDYRWKIIDQRGVTVLEGNVNRALATPQQIGIGQLANGIYFLSIQINDRALLYKKIAVMNRN